MLRSLFFLLSLFIVSMAAAQDATPETIINFTDHPARVKDRNFTPLATVG